MTENEYEKEYNTIRDNLAIGLAQIGYVFDNDSPKEKFEIAFDYVSTEIKTLDILFTRILTHLSGLEERLYTLDNSRKVIRLYPKSPRTRK